MSGMWMRCQNPCLAIETAGQGFRFDAISAVQVFRELGEDVFRKNKEERCLSLDVQRQGRRKSLYLRESGQTKTSWPEKEERRSGNLVPGSPLQQLRGRHAEKPDCSGFSGAARQVDRVASRQFQQQPSGTANMPRFGLSSSCRLSVYSWGKCVACGHSRSQTLPGSCCIRLARAAKAFASVRSMRKTPWAIASDQNGIEVNQYSHFRLLAPN